MNIAMLRTYVLSLAVMLVAGACSGAGGCGCGVEDLPPGGVPGDQTIEGGAQLRISQSGFSTLTELIPAVLQDTLGAGAACVPAGGFGVLVGDIDFCHLNDGTCTPGCGVDLNVDDISISVPADDRLRISMQFDVAVDVPVRFDPIFGGNSSCNIIATSNNLLITMDVNFDIDPATGELELNLLDIPDLDISIGLDASDCGFIIDSVASLVSSVLNGLSSVLGVGFIRDLLTPVLEPIIQGLLPDPLGFEGMANMGGLIGTPTANTNALMEARVVPGGYVHLEGGGMSLGIITGINSDEDPSTRSPDLDSEPALCVPPFAAPDFGAAPANLALSSRSNFLLNPADIFRGIPEANGDIVIGASETMLDQIGHHLIASGAFCVNIGTETIPQLNLGAIGLLVPSFAELGTAEGNDPLLLVTRPAKPMDFTIGDGTETSPSLTMHLSEFSLDFYAFLFERYTRGFTVTLDMNIGINLEFTTDANGNPAILPMLVGLEAANINVTVQNEEFLREDKATLETLFPTILDLVLPLVTGGLGEIALPEIAGFQMNNLSVEHVVTAEDDFLAIFASLGAGSTMNLLGERYPSVRALAEALTPEPAVRAIAKAELVDVIAPLPAQMRTSLYSGIGQKPGVKLNLDTHDQLGRELEWTWNIDGGISRPFIRGGEVTIEDGAFNFQGRYQLQLRARPVGDARAWDLETTPIDVVIDSVGPRILLSKAERSGKHITIPAFDNVYHDDVEIALGTLRGNAPVTEWNREGEFSLELAEELADDGVLQVFARDPQGNLSSTTFRIFDAEERSAGNGGCSAGGGASTWAGLFLLLAVMGLRRKSSLRAVLSKAPVAIALLVGLSAAPGCSCSGDPAGTSCVLDEDCVGLCEEGEIGQCFEDTCRCLNDLPYGRIGQFSAMDMAADGTVWVSAYASEYGDLVVAATKDMGRIPNTAWQYVDGVPEGPVVLPANGVRGGIKADGDDVGQYTDIAVTADGVAMVSYFDKTTGSLKFAANYDGEWHSHIVDVGDLSGDDITLNKLSGQYSAISLSASGIPAIAYFNRVGNTTEVRIAKATGASPRGSGEWTIDMIDSAEVPVVEEEADVLTIPFGTGLFIELVRGLDDSLIAAYYDRINGDLKLAREVSGSFEVETLATDGDVGWYPSIEVDAQGVLHASYVDARNQDLLYINDADGVAELVDDGYRIVGTTEDGLPIPEFHFVGDDSSLVLVSGKVYIAYQDATTHELLVATASEGGVWGHTAVVGDEVPFIGAYGFFANAKFDGSDITMSTFVLDQANSDSWVELFEQSVVID